MSTKGPYPFAAKEEQYGQYTDEMLAWAIKDAAQARDNTRGFDEKAEAWYADDVSTILAEMNRRKGAA